MENFTTRGKMLFLLFVFVILTIICWVHLQNKYKNFRSLRDTSEGHNRERTISEINDTKRRELFGEGGKPCYLRNENEMQDTSSYFHHKINLACSNRIAINRSIPDTRMEECRFMNYPENLPTTSVIIPLKNAAWSALMRAIQSIIDRTPPTVLEEIILIDDFSRTFSIDNLIKHVKTFNGKVKFIQHNNSSIGEGWRRSKAVAARMAEGEVIVFLDPYCEVNVDWLPPLLAPIYENSSVMTVPIIDVIDHTTFEYRPARPLGQTYKGIFDWSLMYRECKPSKTERRNMRHLNDPYFSATHYGELFAINRQYFLSLGGFGSHLLVWGGADLEFSFRIWMCGGSIMMVPCSRVGHIFEHSSFVSSGDQDERNSGYLSLSVRKRIAETWLGRKFRKYFYTQVPQALSLSHGDITEELAQNKELRCKNFQWYLNNVAHDVLVRYPKPPRNMYWGHIVNVASQHCLATMTHGPPGLIWLLPCGKFEFSSLVIRLNELGQLGVEDRCIEGDEKGVWIIPCKHGTTDGPWRYSLFKKTFHHKFQKMCMALEPLTDRPLLATCDVLSNFQKWIFKPIPTPSLNINLKDISNFYVENYN